MNAKIKLQSYIHKFCEYHLVLFHTFMLVLGGNSKIFNRKLRKSLFTIKIFTFLQKK